MPPRLVRRCAEGEPGLVACERLDFGLIVPRLDCGRDHRWEQALARGHSAPER